MQPAVLEKLRGIVGPVHVLTGIELSPYVVEGLTPEAAVFPGSVDEVRGVVAVAAEAEVPVLPWGGGTAASVGSPPARPGIVLGLGRLDAILEYEPGDLTVTAQAGLTLARLQSALRERGQWLSLDPPDAERATLGGIVAANASGPRRQLYGTLRDLLIGVTVVTADGGLVRGGGKVVKNVAGYDLPKLFVGSYGTLGIIVEVTVRLRPLPDAERVVSVRFDRLKDAGTAVRTIMAGDLVPNAIELLDAEASQTRGLPGAVEGRACAALVVGFDGLAEQVDWQCAQLGQITAALGGHGVVPVASATLMPSERVASGTLAAVMRFSVLPTVVTEIMEQGAGVARQRGLLTGWTAHAGVGVVTASLVAAGERPDLRPVAAVLAEWRDMAGRSGGHAVLEWAPLAVKSEAAVWDDPGPAGRLMQRIKTQLDPRNLLNPGRFVAGI